MDGANLGLSLTRDYEIRVQNRSHYVNAKTHAESPKCWIDQKMPGDGVAGHPQPSIVTSYAWVYSW